ncbi:MAG TPA: addiction module protein [Verrucomicrobiae bacterium]|jgi:putative addiction module component (TIGR02574 family)|nr:addiction module protein [Verrucomicrobiae bacterium]
MPTVDQIVKEARQLPREQLAEIVDRLTLSLHEATDPSLEEAWKAETRRRVAEIEKGEVQGIPGEEVSARVRRIVGR